MQSIQSHSLRSAWIEMSLDVKAFATLEVALLTECVDRNGFSAEQVIPILSRTPYGVRG